MPESHNIVGVRIKALRREKGLTQAMLAARCSRLGWDVSENVVTKIETQIRCVTDFELICFAKALGVNPERILPPVENIKSAIAPFFAKRSRS